VLTQHENFQFHGHVQVGNAMLRGISGGQKKRVTLGEMVVGPARALFADEISTGLDSARTYEVIKHLRNLTHIMKATVFCALLTPGPETTDLFDDILVLSAGKIVFYGPREHVMPFYAELGFELPPRLGLADFLQEVNTPMDQDRYWSSGRPYRYLTPRALHQAFQRTEASRRIEEELGSPFPRTQEAKAALAHQKYGSSSGALLRAVARRTWLLQRRTAVFAIIRTFQVVLMAFILSSAFWRESRQTVDDGNYFLGVIFYSVLYQLLGGTSEMHLVVERLPVVHRQEANRFYPGWAFAAPTFLLRLPYSLLESALWSVLVYWIVGFDPSAGHFFMFWLLLFLINAWSIVFFQLVASVARDDTIATAIGSAFLLIFINLNGFVINAADVPPWWLWGLWPNPYFWATRALAINEFTSSNWEQPNPTNPANSLGLDVLDFRGFPSAYWWTWAAVGFIIASG
jgi:ABC-type multidrug transport system permease subunit